MAVAASLWEACASPQGEAAVESLQSIVRTDLVREQIHGR